MTTRSMIKKVVKEKAKKTRPTAKKTPARKAAKKDYDKLFIKVLIEVSEKGKSVIAALKGKMSTQKFYELLEDGEKAKRYARACEMRAEVIASETIDISDSGSDDVNRDRLRVDTRKWILAKLHPKKYGDKIDMTSDGLPINPSITIELIDNPYQVDHEDPSGQKDI